MQASITSDFLNVQFNLETITDSTVASFTSCMITSTIFPKKSLRCSTHIFGYFNFKMDEKFAVIFTRNQMKMLVADVFCLPFQGIKMTFPSLLTSSPTKAGCQGLSSSFHVWNTQLGTQKSKNGWCFCKECYAKIVGQPLLGFKSDSKLALRTECFIHV